MSKTNIVCIKKMGREFMIPVAHISVVSDIGVVRDEDLDTYVFSVFVTGVKEPILVSANNRLDVEKQYNLVVKVLTDYHSQRELFGESI